MAFKGIRDSSSFLPLPTHAEMIKTGDNFQKEVPLCGKSFSATA